MKSLRISQLPMMGHIARGLMPDDLDDMVASEDDAFDLAEALYDVHEELTSAQVILIALILFLMSPIYIHFGDH